MTHPEYQSPKNGRALRYPWGIAITYDAIGGASGHCLDNIIVISVQAISYCDFMNAPDTQKSEGQDNTYYQSNLLAQ